MKKLQTLLFLLTLAGTIMGQESKHSENKMETYYFVMLKKGPNRSQDSLTAAGIQERHLAHIRQMAEEGKLSIAGPFLDDEDWKGILILNVKSLNEAKTLADNDPAVKAGRLIYEIHPWMGMKGSALK